MAEATKKRQSPRKSSGRPASTKSARAGAVSKADANRARPPAGPAANAALAGKGAAAGTKAAGKAISGALYRARAPLIGGGAAAAGFVGGLAVLRRRNG